MVTILGITLSLGCVSILPRRAHARYTAAFAETEVVLRAADLLFLHRETTETPCRPHDARAERTDG